jgi:hypothetical protein
MGHLTATRLCPALLITPVLMYVVQQGVNSFVNHLTLRSNNVSVQ